MVWMHSSWLVFYISAILLRVDILMNDPRNNHASLSWSDSLGYYLKYAKRLVIIIVVCGTFKANGQVPWSWDTFCY